MKKTLENILQAYDYQSSTEFLHSLFPSIKLEGSWFVILVGLLTLVADKVMGVDTLALGAMVAMMGLELWTGIAAAHIRKETITSKKLSRFGIKVACYFILMSVPYLFSQSFLSRGNALGAGIFDWLHTFLVVQIILEYLISILENLAVIQGKPKDHWITSIKEIITNKLKS